MRPLSERELDLLTTARRAVLATISADGTPRLVPITFVYSDAALFTPLDEKRKSVADPRDLGRVHDIERNPRVSVLVDSWSENWEALGWVRVQGDARLVGPDGESAGLHAGVVRLLRAKYDQYASHGLESRPLIEIDLGRVTSWFERP